MHQNEKLFFNELKRIFIGTEVKGKSGFINLMKIKSAYFKVMFNELIKAIDTKTKEFPEFKEEMFQKLFTFFKTYFSESGSIYFSYTPLKSNIYEKVYTNQNDVVIFWKTHMLYYVKTDNLWTNLDLTFTDKDENDHIIHFDISNLEHKSSNVKKETIYTWKGFEENEIYLDVKYSNRGKKAKTKEILNKLKKNQIKIDKETLIHLFRIFESQNEVDFFINMDAESFLQEQFNLWLKNYLFDDESDFNEKRISQLKVLKEIAYEIIRFISVFENELVNIWNKPKFVLNSNYVISLNRIIEQPNGIDLLKEITSSEGFEKQKREWKELGVLKNDELSIFSITLLGKELAPECKYLAIDTRHFGFDIKESILSLFGNLDEELDGWLIHSENYQALNTIKSKFKDKIHVIYIDPPYNSPSSEIIYKNNFKHSSWLTLMQNRLSVSKEFLNDESSLIIAIDENEQERLGLMLEDLFSGYEKTCLSIVHNPRGIQGKNFSYCHEYAFFLLPEGKQVIGKKQIPKKAWEYSNLRAWGGESTRDTGKTVFYPIYVKDNKIVRLGEVPKEDFHPQEQTRYLKNGEIEVWPIDIKGVEKKWRYSSDSLRKKLEAIKVKHLSNRIEIYIAQTEGSYKTTWTGPKYDAGTHGTRLLTNMGIKDKFDFPKSLYTVKDCLKTIINKSKDSIVLDYFAGSGTTAHAIMSLNKADNGKRKFILIEMGEYFNTIIIPRIKKAAYSLNWKKGEPQDLDGLGIFLKYFELEQYEQTLRKTIYKESEPFFDYYDSSKFYKYVFMNDKKLLDAIEINYQTNDVDFDCEKLYTNVDLPETISNLKGKWIKQIGKKVVILEDDEKIDLKNLEFNVIKPLIWW